MKVVRNEDKPKVQDYEIRGEIKPGPKLPHVQWGKQ